MTKYLETAGEFVAVESAMGWTTELVEESVAGELRGGADRPPMLVVEIERTTREFPTAGWEILTRGAWYRDRRVVIRDVMATGFDLFLSIEDGITRCVYRYRPPIRSRALAGTLRRRFILLARCALLQYPALWCAGLRGRAPLHAMVCTAGSMTPLLSGPAGIGKSTVVAMEVAAGGVAASDNLSVSDGFDVWGLVEPCRLEGATGRRSTHGRREGALPRRVPSLRPSALILLRRQTDSAFTVRPASAAQAHDSLITGTYMAGELRRYWGLAATLTAATGLGPPHPAVQTVSRILASRMPAFEVQLPEHSRPRLSELLEHMEAST